MASHNRLTDKLIALVAPEISNDDMDKLALTCFEMTEVKVQHLRRENQNNEEGFNRQILTVFKNKSRGGSTNVSYQSVVVSKNVVG